MEDIFARFKRESKPEMVKNPVINEETIRNLVDTCILVDKGSKEAISGHAHLLRGWALYQITFLLRFCATSVWTEIFHPVQNGPGQGSKTARKLRE